MHLYNSYQLPPNRTSVVYLIILLLVIGSVASLPLIHANISVKTTGIIRPVNERTEVKSSISGIIDTIYYKDGDTVQPNTVLLKLQNNHALSNQQLIGYQITQCLQYISDLKLLTSVNSMNSAMINRLQSSLYKQQLAKFLFQEADQQSSIKKAVNELDINNYLINDKVIAAKELFDKQIENDKLRAGYNAFKQTQLSQWQQDLSTNRLELARLLSQQQQNHIEIASYEIKSSIGGVVQGISGRYSGGLLQAGEILCTISPETNLIAECYVNTKDIGLIKKGQQVNFQIDAFDHNFFGFLSGKVSDIDNDFTLVDNNPLFKVHCFFDSTQLHLKNGYNGQLKKGLTFQSRFIVSNRTLWQLLWDKIDDWLNPDSV